MRSFQNIVVVDTMTSTKLVDMGLIGLKLQVKGGPDENPRASDC